MLRDLAALTPPLMVCGAFVAAVVFFLRRQMGAGRAADPGTEADIRDDGQNAGASDPASARSAPRQRT